VNIDINTYILLAMAMFFAALAVMVILLRNSMFNERKLAAAE
jgi:ABC-type dipeptide/oligopeptide/nickel transport system permease component